MAPSAPMLRAPELVSATSPMRVKSESPPHSFYHSILTGSILGQPLDVTPTRSSSGLSMVVGSSLTPLELSDSFGGNRIQVPFGYYEPSPMIFNANHLCDLQVGPPAIPQPVYPTYDDPHGSFSQSWTTPWYMDYENTELDSLTDQDSLSSPREEFTTQDLPDDYFDEMDQWLDTDYIMSYEAKADEVVD